MLNRNIIEIEKILFIILSPLLPFSTMLLFEHITNIIKINSPAITATMAGNNWRMLVTRTRNYHHSCFWLKD